jgi:pyruvate/2-oxoacid:ferredoxin oxidoreductase alpha subunit
MKEKKSFRYAVDDVMWHRQARDVSSVKDANDGNIKYIYAGGNFCDFKTATDRLSAAFNLAENQQTPFNCVNDPPASEKLSIINSEQH